MEMKLSVLGQAVHVCQKKGPSAVHASASECKKCVIFPFRGDIIIIIIICVKMFFALSA